MNEIKYFDKQKFNLHKKTNNYEEAEILTDEISKEGYKYRIVNKTYEINGRVFGSYFVYKSFFPKNKVFLKARSMRHPKQGS